MILELKSIEPKHAAKEEVTCIRLWEPQAR